MRRQETLNENPPFEMRGQNNQDCECRGHQALGGVPRNHSIYVRWRHRWAIPRVPERPATCAIWPTIFHAAEQSRLVLRIGSALLRTDLVRLHNQGLQPTNHANGIHVRRLLSLRA